MKDWLQVNFETDEGVGEVQIPTKAEHVTLNDFSDFMAHQDRIFKEDAEPDEIISAVIDATACVVKGNLRELPYSHEDESYKKEYSFFTGNHNVLCIEALYWHINTLFRTYKPKDHATNFAYVDSNGTEWRLNPRRATVLLLQPEQSNSIKDLRGLSGGEVIEVKEWRRIITKSIEENGDPDKGLEYKLGLAEMAILLRKKGDRMPHGESERERWITERMLYMKDFPCTVSWDVRFFLTNTLIDYAEKPHLDIFSRTFKVRGPKGVKMR